MLVPLTLLALDVAVARPVALVVLAVFVSGIGRLMVYLWVEVRRMSAPPRVVSTLTEGATAQGSGT
ncbi:MAG: hypothetical protein ACTHNI_00455 [Cellulosimicrobium cellulans]